MSDFCEVILLDLGGVVIELSGVPIWQSWTGAEDEAAVWERWLRSAAVRRFESGRCSADAFAEEIVAEFGLSIQPSDFIREFTLWPKGVYPGVLDLLARVRRRRRVACLSNSNELHWPRFLGEMGLEGVFDPCFSSHELGALKPDREVFDRVVATLGCAPDRILFVDDNEINVRAARAAGLAARQARGPEELRSLLEELELLS